MQLTILVTCAMGLETVLKHELYDLGYNNLTIDNGIISFTGHLNDVIELNLWCRTAGRVFISLQSFTAHSFDDLFDALSCMDWHIWCPKNVRCTIDSVSTKASDLFSQSDIQSIAKKAIITSLQRHYSIQTIDELGPHVPIRIYIENNQVSIRLDTSGHGLNKRYTRFDAPLRETLAAAMLKLSRWNPDEDALIDPCCGSGTILIEAGMIANHIAPGLSQKFCSESWPIFSSTAWEDARTNAASKQKASSFRIYGSDINPDILKTARFNIKRANLHHIFVETKNLSAIRSRFDRGKIICNPPYGIRLEDQGAAIAYASMGHIFQQHFSIGIAIFLWQ